MSGWAWSGKWRCRTPGYPDPGSPEGPAPSLWEQRGGVSAGRLPAAGLPRRLCTTRWPQGARSPFPQPGPCDQTPQAGKACTPSPAGGLHAAAGGWAGSPGPHPALVAWCCCSGKKESVCVFTSLVQGGNPGPTAQGAPALTPQLAEGGRPGWAVGLRPSGLQSRRHNRSKVVTGCPRSAGATRPAVCLCVSGHLALLPGWKGWGPLSLWRGAHSWSQEAVVRGSGWQSLGPAESRAQTLQGDRRAAERASDAAVQALTSSPPASNLPPPPLMPGCPAGPPTSTLGNRGQEHTLLFNGRTRVGRRTQSSGVGWEGAEITAGVGCGGAGPQGCQLRLRPHGSPSVHVPPGRSASPRVRQCRPDPTTRSRVRPPEWPRLGCRPCCWAVLPPQRVPQSGHALRRAGAGPGSVRQAGSAADERQVGTAHGSEAQPGRSSPTPRTAIQAR